MARDPVCRQDPLDLTSEIVTAPWCWAGHLLLWPVVLAAAWRAPWWHLRDPVAAQVLVAACIGVLAAWSMGAVVTEGVRVHLLGATLLTLMFGWEFALLALLLVASASALNGHGDWAALGVNATVGALVPVGVSRLVRWGSERYLPPNFFVYIFVSAFLGAALAMGAAGLVSTLVLAAAPPLPVDNAVAAYGRLFLLLMYPEAFVTGILMSIFVVYKPQWVSTFDDDRYLRGR